MYNIMRPSASHVELSFMMILDPQNMGLDTLIVEL